MVVEFPWSGLRVPGQSPTSAHATRWMRVGLAGSLPIALYSGTALAQSVPTVQHIPVPLSASPSSASVPSLVIAGQLPGEITTAARSSLVQPFSVPVSTSAAGVPEIPIPGSVVLSVPPVPASEPSPSQSEWAIAPSRVTQPIPVQIAPQPSTASSEDALIEQMSGQAVATPTQAVATPAIPVFAPQPAIANQPSLFPAPAQPQVVSATRNSDVGGQYFGAPGRSTATAPCYSGTCYTPPIAQVTTIPVSMPATLGQSTAFPPTPPLGASSESPMSPVSPMNDGSGLIAPPSSDRANPYAPTTRLGESPIAPPSRQNLLRSTALGSPSVKLQGAFIYQGDDSSARARLSILYPLTPQFLFGANVDLTDGNAFSDSRDQGLSLNELYFALSPKDLPNLRFVVGQLDLTSYFDRNSFAKDGATHFFNPVFQTNPALSATGISSRPGVLVNWSLTDNIEAKAAAFSSSRRIGDFSLDGFAGELGIRYGNAIIRGTYVTDRESGSRDGFREIFQVDRGDGQFGPRRGDREESFGVNAEVYIPNLRMGLFGRYGRYTNNEIDRTGDTYSVGLSFLDVFNPDDRIGLAYGRELSNDRLRRDNGDERPDVLELFYDFRFLSNLRMGFMVQQRNNFSETIAGFRVKTEFDVTPNGKQPGRSN